MITTSYAGISTKAGSDWYRELLALDEAGLEAMALNPPAGVSVAVYRGYLKTEQARARKASSLPAVGVKQAPGTGEGIVERAMRLQAEREAEAEQVKAEAEAKQRRFREGLFGKEPERPTDFRATLWDRR